MQADAMFDSRLAALRRRVRLLVAERTALAAGAWAAAACIALAALDKLRLWRVDWQYLAALIAAAVVVGWMWGFLHRPGKFDVARAAESRLALKERLSSAVALQPLAEQDPMVAALLDDARLRLQPVQPRRLFPRRMGRRGQAFIALLVLLGAAIILPELPAFQSRATRRERAALRRQGQRLVRLAGKLEKRPLPQRGKLLKQVALNMKSLGKEMQTARVTRKQALVRLDKLEKQAKLAQEAVAGERGEKSLAQAAKELTAAQDAAAQMRAAKMARLMSQLEDMKAGKAEGNATSRRLTPEQMKALEKLSSGFKSLQSQNLDLPDDAMKALADALARKDVQEALRILQGLQKQLLAKKEMQEALRILERVAKKMQTEQALRELAELAKKLQDEKTLKKMSPEDMKRLADQLVKMAQALKGTDLDRLARQMLELAKALERGDIRLCQACAGKVGGT